MDQQTSPIIIERLTQPTKQDINTLQNLLAQLSNRFAQYTIPVDLINTIIISPHHDILVARDRVTGAIIGCATLSITTGIGAGKRAWLDDFVTDNTVQGKGVGSLLWNEMLAWAQQHGATAIQFTSSDKHRSAHNFYLKRGAIIRDTNFFKKQIDPR